MPVPQEAISELTEGFSKLLASGLFSDLVIKCGDRTWNVHCPIICPRSSFFLKAVTSGFEEASSREIELRGDEPALIDRMVRYLYSLDYDDAQLEDGKEYISKLHCNALMYALGDRYDIQGLKVLATEKLNRANYGQMYRDKKTLAELMAVIPVIYTSTVDSDRTLRDVVVELATSSTEQYSSIRKRDDFKMAVETVPQFAWDLIEKTGQFAVLDKCGHCDDDDNGRLDVSDGFCNSCGRRWYEEYY